MESPLTITSPESPWKDWRNMRSHPPMTLMTTMTIVVQSMTATRETQAMRRLRRYLRMRWSLYMGQGERKDKVREERREVGRLLSFLGHCRALGDCGVARF